MNNICHVNCPRANLSFALQDLNSQGWVVPRFRSTGRINEIALEAIYIGSESIPLQLRIGVKELP
jgi:hypothetical protein